MPLDLGTDFQAGKKLYADDTGSGNALNPKFQSVKTFVDTLESDISDLETNKVNSSLFPDYNAAIRLPNPVSLTSSSGVLTLLSTSNSFIANGTEAITSITGWTQGIAIIRWNTARTLTYNASTLILQNSSNRTTVQGDVGIYEMTSSGAREIGYFPVSSPVFADINLSNLTLATALNNLGFTGKSLTTNGYYKLPGSFIVQWGSFTFSSGTASITFPITFPSAVLCPPLISFQVNDYTYSPGIYNLTTSGCRVNGSSAINWSCNYLVIGY